VRAIWLVAGEARVVLLRVGSSARGHAGRPLGGQVGLDLHRAPADLAPRDQATVEVRVGGPHRDVEIRDADHLVAGTRSAVAVTEREPRYLHLEVALVVALYLPLADAVGEGGADGPRDSRHGRTRKALWIRQTRLRFVSDGGTAGEQYHPDETGCGQKV